MAAVVEGVNAKEGAAAGAPRKDRRLREQQGGGAVHGLSRSILVPDPNSVAGRRAARQQMERNWAPLPGSQVYFLSSPVYETLYEGTRGPGKTMALLMDFAQHCGQGFGPYWRGVLFRQTYKQLGDVVAKSKLLFRSVFPGAKWNATDYTWTFPDGEQLLLRHIRVPDDYWNYHGHEYPWIGFEELTNWPTAECYESMFACSRSALPGMPRKYRGTCNPYGAGHNWVKRRFIDPAPRGSVMRDANGLERVAIHGDVTENTHLLAADPDYIRRLESITNPAKREAWLHGSWAITSGGMFDDLWDSSVHVLDPFRIPDGWKLDRSFDWGSSKPFSVGWWAESDGSAVDLGAGNIRMFPKGTLIRIAEWYGWTGKENEGLRMLAQDIGAGILEREDRMGILGRVKPGPADPSIYSTEDGHSIAASMEKARVKWVPATSMSGSRKAGWEAMRTRIQNSVTREGPGLYVFDSCQQFLRTVVPIPRDEDDPDDVDTDVEDHVADEARYRVTAPARSFSITGLKV